MTKFFNKFEKLCFWHIFGLFSQFLGKTNFSRKLNKQTEKRSSIKKKAKNGQKLKKFMLPGCYNFLQNFFQHFCLKVVYFTEIFLKYIYYFPAQKHIYYIKFQNTSASILSHISTSEILISGISAIVNIGKQETREEKAK